MSKDRMPDQKLTREEANAVIDSLFAEFAESSSTSEETDTSSEDAETGFVPPAAV